MPFSGERIRSNYLKAREAGEARFDALRSAMEASRVQAALPGLIARFDTHMLDPKLETGSALELDSHGTHLEDRQAHISFIKVPQLTREEIQISDFGVGLEGTRSTPEQKKPFEDEEYEKEILLPKRVLFIEQKASDIFTRIEISVPGEKSKDKIPHIKLYTSHEHDDAWHFSERDTLAALEQAQKLLQ